MVYPDYNDDEIIYLIKEDEEALSLMIRKYEPLFKKLAFSFVKKYSYKGLDIDDLVQQCRIAMCYALESYNPSNETKFYSFLLVCLRRAINNYSRSYLKNPNVYSLDEEELYLTESLSVDSLTKKVIENDTLRLIKKFSLSLNFFDACVFELRFNNFTYKEIAVLLDTNVKKVDNTLLKIRKKLEFFLEKSY